MRVGAILDYLAFAAVTSLVAWLAWSDRSKPENPSLILLITWVVAGVTHNIVHDLWRAGKIAAIASVLVYAALVVFLNAVNEMLVAGMMLVGGVGFVLAMAMGVPVAM